MNYDLTSASAPKMPTLGKGTDSIKLLLSQCSKDMQESLVPMIFPILGAHLAETEFMYPDRSWKEMTGMMACLVADSGAGKGQLTGLVEAVCADFRQHDKAELQKLVEWQKLIKTKSANKEKPARPDVAFWIPPSDVTNAAFIQNAMACEALGGRTQYLNLPEVEMADRMCGSHKQISQTMRNIYDRQRAGALRATADGVTGNPILRVNMTISSTPYAARKFFKNDLFNGTFGRMVFSYKPRVERSGRIPRQGAYSDEFQGRLNAYIARLNVCKGRFTVNILNRLIDSLAMEMAALADLTDDDMLWDVSKRALVSAWKAGCIMWILNGQVWSKHIGDMVVWLAYHDLWSKMQVFSDFLKSTEAAVNEPCKTGPKNMLDSLPDSFSEAQLEALRQQMNKTKDPRPQLNVWVQRGFIVRSKQPGMYLKTDNYLKRRR